MPRPTTAVAYSATPTHINNQPLAGASLTSGGAASQQLRGQMAATWTPPAIAMTSTEVKTNDAANYRNYDGGIAIIDQEYPIMGLAGIQMMGYVGYSMTFVVRVAYTDGQPSAYVAGVHQGADIKNVRFVLSGPLHTDTPGEVGAGADAITTFVQELTDLQVWERTGGTPAAPVFSPIRHLDVENGFNRVRVPGVVPTALTDLLDLSQAYRTSLYPGA